MNEWTNEWRIIDHHPSQSNFDQNNMPILQNCPLNQIVCLMSHRSKAWYTGSFGITAMSSFWSKIMGNNTASRILHRCTSKFPSESNMMIVRGRLCVGRTSNYSVRVICEWKCQKVGTRATFKKPCCCILLHWVCSQLAFICCKGITADCSFETIGIVCFAIQCFLVLFI
jgi:hypothetical protein